MKPPAADPLPLTADMLETYQFIRAYCSQFGFPPTLREIAKARGRSVTGIVHQLNRLESAGYLHRHFNRTRALTLLKP